MSRTLNHDGSLYIPIDLTKPRLPNVFDHILIGSQYNEILGLKNEINELKERNKDLMSYNDQLLANQHKIFHDINNSLDSIRFKYTGFIRKDSE